MNFSTICTDSYTYIRIKITFQMNKQTDMVIGKSIYTFAGCLIEPVDQLFNR